MIESQVNSSFPCGMRDAESQGLSILFFGLLVQNKKKTELLRHRKLTSFLVFCCLGGQFIGKLWIVLNVSVQPTSSVTSPVSWRLNKTTASVSPLTLRRTSVSQWSCKGKCWKPFELSRRIRDFLFPSYFQGIFKLSHRSEAVKFMCQCVVL